MSKSKNKGRRGEHKIVDMHTTAGVPAERVPLSGSLGGKYDGDVHIKTPHEKLIGEVKCRTAGSGWKVLTKWLADKDVLFLKQDYKSPYVFMPWATYEKLIKAYNE